VVSLADERASAALSKDDPRRPPDRIDAPNRSRSALFALAAIAILYLGREVLIPVALAILLTFIVTPLVVRIERRVRSRALAVLLATMFVIGLLGGTTVFVGMQFVGLAEQIPGYRQTIVRKVRSIQAGPGTVLARVEEMLRRFDTEVSGVPQRPAGESPPADAAPAATRPDTAIPRVVAPATPHTSLLNWSTFSPILGPLASAAIIVLLLVMMLMSRENIRDRIIRLAGLHQIGFTTQTLEEAGARVGRYLRSQLLINTIYGSSIAIGLFFLGVPNAALCGLVAGVLRFIPILGPWLAAVIPAVLAFVVFDGWQPLITVVSLFAALEIFTSFVLEPWLYGTSTGLSGVGIILAIIFWSWVWGPVGLVLAVPMTVCVVVFTRHIPHLGALSILLGNEPVLSDSMRFYQRLLCRDESEAAAILAATPEGTEPARTLDEIVVPCLVAARSDLQRGLISQEQAAWIGVTAKELALEWLSDREPTRPQPALGPTAPHPASVVCIPAHDALDDAGASLFSELLRREGVHASPVSTALLFGEKVAAAQAAGVGLIVVSRVGSAADLYTRRLSKAVRKSVGSTPVVIVAWAGDPSAPHSPSEPAPAAVITTADALASTNLDAIRLVRSLLNSRAPAAVA
jgi:predicted PurR-regulated permease PerM